MVLNISDVRGLTSAQLEQERQFCNLVATTSHVASKSSQLLNRYSTGESGMIVELFSRRPFIKILFCRFKILIFRFLIITYFTENFTEISQKFLRNFSENSYPPPTPLTYPPYHPPRPNTHNPEPTQNFKSTFLEYTFFVELGVFFPPVSYI